MLDQHTTTTHHPPPPARRPGRRPALLLLAAGGRAAAGLRQAAGRWHESSNWPHKCCYDEREQQQQQAKTAAKQSRGACSNEAMASSRKDELGYISSLSRQLNVTSDEVRSKSEELLRMSHVKVPHFRYVYIMNMILQSLVDQRFRVYSVVQQYVCSWRAGKLCFLLVVCIAFIYHASLHKFSLDTNRLQELSQTPSKLSDHTLLHWCFVSLHWSEKQYKMGFDTLQALLDVQIYKVSLRELAVKLGSVRVVDTAVRVLEDFKVSLLCCTVFLFNHLSSLRNVLRSNCPLSSESTLTSNHLPLLLLPFCWYQGR